MTGHLLHLCSNPDYIPDPKPDPKFVPERFAAQVAGLMPSGDDWEVATAESVGAFMMDVSDETLTSRELTLRAMLPSWLLDAVWLRLGRCHCPGSTSLTLLLCVAGIFFICSCIRE